MICGPPRYDYGGVVKVTHVVPTRPGWSRVLEASWTGGGEGLGGADGVHRSISLWLQAVVERVPVLSFLALRHRALDRHISILAPQASLLRFRQGGQGGWRVGWVGG